MPRRNLSNKTKNLTYHLETLKKKDEKKTQTKHQRRVIESRMRDISPSSPISSKSDACSSTETP